MFFNKRVTVIRSQKTTDDAGAAIEIEDILAENVPAMIQGHTIQSLPPPGQFHREAGIVYVRDHRCWIDRKALAYIRVNDYIVDPSENDRKYRVMAVIDDAGVQHHWLLRITDYQ